MKVQVQLFVWGLACTSTPAFVCAWVCERRCIFWSTNVRNRNMANPEVSKEAICSYLAAVGCDARFFGRDDTVKRSILC